MTRHHTRSHHDPPAADTRPADIQDRASRGCWAGCRAVVVCAALLAMLTAPLATAQMRGPQPPRQPTITGISLDPAVARSTAGGQAVPAGEVDATLDVSDGETEKADAAKPSTKARNIVPLGPDGLPDDRHRQVPDLGRLHDQLMREAQIESYLDESDLRHLTAVRAYVERTGRVPDRYIQDHSRHFEDSRRTVQQMAKEAMRDYLKQQVGWEAMQDRMKVRVKSLFRFGRDGGDDRPRRAEAPDLAAAAGAAPRRAGFGDVLGSIEVGPEIRLDLDDTELGVDVEMDTAGASFLDRWELYYGQKLESGDERFRLRYTNNEAKRWFELTAGVSEFERGDYVAISMTTLF